MMPTQEGWQPQAMWQLGDDTLVTKAEILKALEKAGLEMRLKGLCYCWRCDAARRNSETTSNPDDRGG